MLSADDAADLLEAIAIRQDRVAFARLFEHFGPRIKAFLMRGGTNSETAEEVVQESFIIVWRKAASFDRRRASVSTWLFTIVRNKRIDHLRRNTRRRIEPEEFVLAMMPEAKTAETSIAGRQTYKQVESLLGTLKASQLEVIRKAFLEEKPHAQIAEELKLPLGTVKSRIRLTLLQLREAMQKDET
jgi:RNA polymerase sigma-70 factor (ECF subfamily)